MLPSKNQLCSWCTEFVKEKWQVGGYVLVPLILSGCVTPHEKCKTPSQEYQVIYRENPLYPKAAHEQGVEGWGLVELTITDKGEPSEIRYVEGEPEGVFEKASLNAAKKMKFSPRVINCKSIPVTEVLFRYHFSMTNE